MRLFACLIVAPQWGYDEPAILSYAISLFCPTSADGLQLHTANSGGCARSTIKSSAGCVPRCSDSSKNATRNSTMTNGGTKRAPCVGRTDMTYRRPRSGRSASTHGWYPEAKTSRTGIKAKNDGGRSHAREAWGWVLGVAYNRSLLPRLSH